MPRRVRRPKQHVGLFASLTDSAKEGPFDTYKDVLLFASALGFERDCRKPFDSTEEPIAWDVFKPSDRAIVNLISLADQGELAVLSDDRIEERITVFEEYANGGLEILEREVISGTRTIMSSLIDLLIETKHTDDSNALPDLEDISRMLGDDD